MEHGFFLIGSEHGDTYSSLTEALEAVQQMTVEERGQGVMDSATGKIYDNVGQQLYVFTYTEYAMMMALFASLAHAAAENRESKVLRLFWAGVAACGPRVQNEVVRRVSHLEKASKDKDTRLHLLQSRLTKALEVQDYDEVARITQKMKEINQ